MALNLNLVLKACQLKSPSLLLLCLSTHILLIILLNTINIRTRRIKHLSTPLERRHGPRKAARLHILGHQRPGRRRTRVRRDRSGKSEGRSDDGGLAGVGDARLVVDEGRELRLRVVGQEVGVVPEDGGVTSVGDVVDAVGEDAEGGY